MCRIRVFDENAEPVRLRGSAPRLRLKISPTPSQFRPDRDAGRVAWVVAVYLTRLCA